MPQRFLFTTDLHLGYERKHGRTVPLHDPRAWAAVMAFAADFKPQTWICGGDMLDCGAISHHTRWKAGQLEGLRLLADAQEAQRTVMRPIEQLVGKGRLVYHLGNHEDWANDVVDEIPGLEGIVDVKSLLQLDRWTVIPQGKASSLGKLTFIHGDQIRGGEHVAKAAVVAYERNVRFGHHHTFQVYTKTSALDLKLPKTGIAVPCLCSKDPKYGEGAPNRWVQGFLWGTVFSDGSFSDHVSVIVDGRFHVQGRTYRG